MSGYVRRTRKRVKGDGRGPITIRTSRPMAIAPIEAMKRGSGVVIADVVAVVVIIGGTLRD